MQNPHKLTTPCREAILQGNLQSHRIAGIADQLANDTMCSGRSFHVRLLRAPNHVTMLCPIRRCAAYGTHPVGISAASRSVTHLAIGGVLTTEAAGQRQAGQMAWPRSTLRQDGPSLRKSTLVPLPLQAVAVGYAGPNDNEKRQCLS